MKQVVKIWVLVVAMVMGGALPPQAIGDDGITMQWCAQAKNKHKKNKKSKKKDKVKKDKKQAASHKKSKEAQKKQHQAGVQRATGGHHPQGRCQPGNQLSGHPREFQPLAAHSQLRGL